MQKLISSGKNAMDKILKGVSLVADPVKSTMSPRGRTVIISKSFVGDYNVNNYPVEVSKDGYKVAMSIQATDPEVQVGVQLIQEAAAKQMRDAGDATSTVCLLTQAILEGGLKLLNEGANPVELVGGINAAVEYVVGELKKMSTPIDGDIEKIRQVATVCSNNDTVIGNLIATAFDKIGADGVIDIEESKNRETSIKISDGIKYPAGWASQYFVTNKAKAESVLENPYILIYDRPVTILKDIMPLLQKVLEQEQKTNKKRPLMIICDATDGEALATFTFNTQQGGLQTCVTEMKWLGEYKREFLEDVAAATGGVFINELKGKKLEKVELSDLGQAQKIVVSKNETVIIGGLKDEVVFNSLVDSIKELEAKEEDDNEKEKLRKRLARLTGSVATLSVGATTEVEMKEKKDRIDDATRATRSAIESGFIVGSGTAFLRVKDTVIHCRKLNDVFREGAQLVHEAIQKSLEQICANAGVESKVANVYNLEGSFGFNAKTNEIEDLVKSGIIEPTKSNICALQNAASVSCQILSSSFMITDTL